MNVDLDKVPVTPPEAVQMFHQALSNEEKTSFKEVDEKDIALFYGLAEELKDLWSLNDKESPLLLNFKSIGISHVDDMLSIILVSTRRLILKQPIKLKEQVEYFQEYWMKKIGKKMP